MRFSALCTAFGPMCRIYIVSATYCTDLLTMPIFRGYSAIIGAYCSAWFLKHGPGGRASFFLHEHR